MVDKSKQDESFIENPIEYSLTEFLGKVKDKPIFALEWLAKKYETLGNERLPLFKQGDYSSLVQQGIQTQVQEHWSNFLPESVDQNFNRWDQTKEIALGGYGKAKNWWYLSNSEDVNSWESAVELAVRKFNTKKDMEAAYAVLFAIPQVEAHTIRWMGDLLKHAAEEKTIGNFTQRPTALINTVGAITDSAFASLNIGFNDIIGGKIPFSEYDSDYVQYDDYPVDRIHNKIESSQLLNEDNFLRIMRFMCDQVFNKSPYGFLLADVYGGLLKQMQYIALTKYQLLTIEGSISAGPAIMNTAKTLEDIYLMDLPDNSVEKHGYKEANEMEQRMRQSLNRSLQDAAHNSHNQYNRLATSIELYNLDSLANLRRHFEHTTEISVKTTTIALMTSYALMYAMVESGANPRYFEKFTNAAEKLPQPKDMVLEH